MDSDGWLREWGIAKIATALCSVLNFKFGFDLNNYFIVYSDASANSTGTYVRFAIFSPDWEEDVVIEEKKIMQFYFVSIPIVHLNLLGL